MLSREFVDAAKRPSSTLCSLCTPRTCAQNSSRCSGVPPSAAAASERRLLLLLLLLQQLLLPVLLLLLAVVLELAGVLALRKIMMAWPSRPRSTDCASDAPDGLHYPHGETLR